MNAASRAVWLVTGSAWAARSLLGFTQPNFTSPVTALDWLAVWLFTACWLLLAPSVILLARLAASRQVMAIAGVVAVAALCAGVANAVEDGLGAKAWGTLYIVGSLTGWFGLLALAFATNRVGHARLAKLCLALFVGFLLFPLGGGFISLIAWAMLAIAPSNFGSTATVRSDPHTASGTSS